MGLAVNGNAGISWHLMTGVAEHVEHCLKRFFDFF